MDKVLEVISEVYKEIEAMEFIGSGATTLAFKKPNKPGRVYCYTIDKSKLKWLAADKSFKYKLLSIKEYNGVKIYKYKMVPLTGLTIDDKSYIKNMLLRFISLLEVNKKLHPKDLLPILPFTNYEFRKLIKEIISVYGDSDDYIDIHHKQFMRDKKGRYKLLEVIHNFEKTNKKINKLLKPKG